MKKFIVAGLVIAGLGILAPVHADTTVYDPTPNGAFSDSYGNRGYVSVGTDHGVRACNENEKTPAGDKATGYAYVSPGGGEAAIAGTRDADGDTTPTEPNQNDCPQ